MRARPAVIGHRGIPVRFPDNTRSGIEAAARICDMVEIDVRRTADGVPVLSHDAVLGGRVLVETPWREIAQIDLGGGHRPITLHDALDVGVPLDIEIKNHPRDPDFDPDLAFPLEVAALARGSDVVTCFHRPTVDAIRRRYPDTTTGLLVEFPTTMSDAIEAAARQGHRIVAPPAGLIAGDLASIGRAHGRGLEVVVWTVNDPEMARVLAQAGVDGIISDDPETILAALEAG